LLELAGLEEYAKFRKPEIVFFFYFEGDDLYDLEKHKSSPTLMSYLQPEFSQNLINRQKEIDRRLGRYILEAEAKERAGGYKKMKSFLWVKRVLQLQRIRLHTQFGGVFVLNPLFSEIMRKVRDRTAKWGGRALLCLSA
jgi:hypothetical protein